MLIVIAVIAILYTLAAANVMSMQIEAKIAITKGDLKTLKFALDSYIEKNYVCPRKSDYQRILIHEEPTIIFSNLLDPFAKTSNIMYPYEISNNKKNYVVYSIGPNRNGKATIGNDGRVLIKGSPIFETNGYD
jgi:type II secretory pathway pseudopilin PulG